MLDYSIDVISHHPDFKNKSLKKYYVEGVDTVGAYGNEPFEIVFRNYTNKMVQVKLSLDGTDILTGKLADTTVSKDMWVVNAFGILSLKAWPESHQGGAQFIFTDSNKSVAVHTHGDLSNRGIIAAAVYAEGYITPQLIYYPICNDYWNKFYWINNGDYNNWNDWASYNSSTTNIGYNNDVSFNCDVSENNQNLAAVGAGEYINQNISYTTGLIEPYLSKIIKVKYMWYNDLVSLLQKFNYDTPQPTGFPGDKPSGINLGATPRITGYNLPKATNNNLYARF